MRTLVTLHLLVSCGCGLSLGPAEDLATVESALKQSCDDFYCGTNGPKLHDYRFSELNADGLPDPDGMRLESARWGGVLVNLSVDGTQVTIDGPGIHRTGPDVVGTVLRVTRPGLNFLDVAVIDSKPTSFIDGSGPPGASPTFWAYRLVYSDPDTGQRRDVCDGAVVVDDSLVGTWVLFSRGDRYDKKSGRITAIGNAAVGAWFNMSCAGDPIAKLVRIKHVEAAEVPGVFHTSLDQRQAALDMFTANYCGDGHFYTTPGRKLRWQDEAGVAEPAPQGAFEAVWDGHGAVCLSTPRFMAPTSCSKPACTPAQQTGWKSYGSFESALPALGFLAPK